MPSNLLDITELAAYLNVPVKTVYTWRSAGRPCPPAVKIGKHLRWREADVENWLANQVEKTTAA